MPNLNEVNMTMENLTQAYSILNATKELLTPYEAWTQGALARDETGAKVSSHSGEAVCWCFDGGMRKIVKDMGIEWYNVKKSSVCFILPSIIIIKSVMAGIVTRHYNYHVPADGNLEDFNDCIGTSHKAILGAIEKTLKHIEQAINCGTYK